MLQGGKREIFLVQVTRLPKQPPHLYYAGLLFVNGTRARLHKGCRFERPSSTSVVHSYARRTYADVEASLNYD